MQLEQKNPFNYVTIYPIAKAVWVNPCPFPSSVILLEWIPQIYIMKTFFAMMRMRIQFLTIQTYISHTQILRSH